MADEDQKELELDVPNGNDMIETSLGEGEVETIVELPQDDNEPIQAVAEPAAPVKETAEHEEYSTRVRKRIEKMTAKLREAERREQAAVEYAKQVQAQMGTLQSRVVSLDRGYLSEAKNRVDSQIAIAEANLQNAIETGDGKAVVEAQRVLNQLSIQSDRVNTALSQRQAAPQQPEYQQQYQYQTPQQPQEQPKRVDPKAEDWADKNEWFGQDQAMTYAAFGIHNQLKDEGFDLSSDEYYDELNRRIRKEFPHKFKRTQESVQAPAQNVAPATRSTTTGPNGRKSIKLTPSEVAIARKLGVPLEEYAKHVRRAS